MNKKKIISLVLITFIAMMISLIFWLTLFSRIGTDLHSFLPPFWSYRAIMNGNGKVLIENVENIMLFLPIGVTLALLMEMKTHQAIFVGFVISLFIETCQWLFWLGSFEFDDLLHNTIGSGMGAVLVYSTTIGGWLRKQVLDKKKSLTVLICISVLFTILQLGYYGIKIQRMRHLAALNDKEGMKNLLILNSDPVYIGATDVSVLYNSDGSLLVEGASENRAWIRIAKATLMQGHYSLEGLSGVQENTIGLELASFDDDQRKYVMVGYEVGAIDELSFELQETTKIIVLISIYPGWEGSIIARPAVFQED